MSRLTHPFQVEYLNLRALFSLLVEKIRKFMVPLLLNLKIIFN